MSPPPEGESLFEVRTRVCRTFAKWIKKSAEEGKVLIVVTHYFPLVTLNEVITGGETISPHNCSITSFAWQSGGFRAIRINDTDYLGDGGHDPATYVTGPQS